MTTLLAFVLLVQVTDPDRLREPAMPAGEWAFQARATFWWPNLNSRFRAREGPDSTSISLDDNLHVPDEVPFGIYEVGVARLFPEENAWCDIVKLLLWGNHWIGTTTLDAHEIFNGMTFNAGDRVSTEYGIWDLGIDVGSGILNPIDRNGLGFGSVGLRVVEVSTSMTGPVGEVDESTRLLYFGGSVGYRWQRGIFAASMSTGFFWSGWWWDDVIDEREYGWNAVLWEFSASAGFETGRVSLRVGARMDANHFTSVREERDSSERNVYNWFLGGPFAEVAVRF